MRPSLNILDDELIGRMARFTVRPRSLPPEQLTRVAGAFTDPR